jgi:uncharacterized protein YjbI with pentapeptide repeats
MTWVCLIWAVRPLQGAKLPETPEERLCMVLVFVGAALALLLARPLAAQWRRLPTPTRAPRIVRERTGRRRAWFGWDLEEPAIYRGMNSFYGADLAGEDLTGADFDGVILSRADLTDARLTRARLVRARLVHACLSRADLTGASLREANLSGAKLDGANLTNASLAGADLRGADLTGANLAGARYDRRTCWPVGFDPRERGAVWVE